MDPYYRAYRDPHSPLTPLTPLSSQNVFTFDFGAATKQTFPADLTKEKFKCKLPRRYSEKFLKLRQIFEKQQENALRQSPARQSDSPIFLRIPKMPKQQQQQPKKSHLVDKKLYRITSPIASKPLSPRIEKLLENIELDKYKALFQQEEIDFDIFCMLDNDDLNNLSITDCEDQCELLKAIANVSNFC